MQVKCWSTCDGLTGRYKRPKCACGEGENGWQIECSRDGFAVPSRFQTYSADFYYF